MERRVAGHREFSVGINTWRRHLSPLALRNGEDSGTVADND